MDPACFVLVACKASATLAADLRHAGVRAESTSDILTPEQVPARASAIILAADDFPSIAVVTTVARLRAQRPGLRILLITAWPEELTGLLVQMTGRVAPVVLREPAALSNILAALGSEPSRAASC